MKVLMTKEIIEKALGAEGEILFIGSKTSALYENQQKVADVGSVTCDIGAPLYRNATQEGASIQVKIDNVDKRPNVKPMKPIKFINLVYDPYASVATGNNPRGVLIDRFSCDGVEALNPQDRLYDETTGEILGAKPVEANSQKVNDKK
ncbi:hypothetical protein CKN73_09110 [Carnobacterium divergens]|uniref:Uncharacterized protein n=1 Tax=Carnobacterium maltaromaticum TaxID=2751 RepID=A0AAW9JW02_CARML|nr:MULTISPECIES: hypothetical protein [Carnobacterium]KRN59858.1 hypothetical protein IV70_GL001353 [Carnobacterium maltaromaticum DSM 20342]MDZ5759788.1 hypothetical protein [Carnobacterium maltaromaticum]TFI72260.1 hypothetical protein CKN81_08945 [Carnobacterium divergens]TFJ40460.1 hypothetical protein CKN77_09210 [Carnobacterium divergens]TFJ49080.1 hypothetical protein CKN73_09110 [Carnobacterium divergens]